MKSKSDFFEFIPFTGKAISNYLSIREGETKIGERLNDDHSSPECKYVIIGISEDIGPQANLGLKGSKFAFDAFLSRFINIQSNRFLEGDEICVFGEIVQSAPFISVEEGRKRIELLDEFVQEIIQPVIALGKIPIVIGGGHNNAYALIRSCFSVLKKSIDVINLDPHADCRDLEGRHSGNPFSYAKERGFLNHYTVLGLHQQYNGEKIYTYLDKNNFKYTFFEDYLDKKRNLRDDIHSISAKRSAELALGIELDLDSIAMMPSSAFTPSGFSIEEARNYMREVATLKNIAYLHLPEGAPNSESEKKVIGKTLSYLVADFIKVNSSKK